ncbi:MAG: hypothetical protein AUG06_05540 [Actinobacteria bacterium 13_1_20CM_2_65_11]|nr:MAG: hypothetical protein AUH69_03135 [Actinobacteria bacterium 13_1_40CM_4_65_12]OLD48845.1 MAG: hypothetical protein AUI42_10735 [Actinobacteria bacterium 13_1_40CM_2_65_8]OLE80217.1 MAG: hypothetical protein AUG06_05540 [Actinobacteria bacterium 13_1_20CM_2_65_11]
MTGRPGARAAHSSILRETAVVCALLGLAASGVAGVVGHTSVGIGVAIGLLLGSTNGYLIVALLDQSSSFLFASLMRLAILSAVAFGAAFLLQSSTWSVLLGVGGAQLVMVAAAVRQGLRA